MTTKQLLKSLMGTGLPKGDLKQEMFSFYNSKIGTSEHFVRRENPNTSCGSCIQRVKTSIWKWYHHDASSPNYKGFVFTGRFVAHGMPLYNYDEK
jgi:hypothetical protein